MKILQDAESLRAWSAAARIQGHRIGFCPTMGALHDGHLSLVRQAYRSCDRVVVSIFVNPTQFGPREDFQNYPRTLEADQQLLQSVGCDAIFLPSATEIYPSGHQTTVQVEPLGSELCGRHRPSHFQGVATVVTILLNLVQPDAVFFGCKDYQQWILIRRLVQDLHLPIRVEGLPTIREDDGLAMSSRNRFLPPAERRQATAIYQALLAGRQCWQTGERSRSILETVGRQRLLEAGIDRIDYVEVRDAVNLEALDPVAYDSVILIAVRVGSVRLIDNLALAGPNGSGFHSQATLEC